MASAAWAASRAFSSRRMLNGLTVASISSARRSIASSASTADSSRRRSAAPSSIADSSQVSTALPRRWPSPRGHQAPGRRPRRTPRRRGRALPQQVLGDHQGRQETQHVAEGSTRQHHQTGLVTGLCHRLRGGRVRCRGTRRDHLHCEHCPAAPDVADCGIPVLELAEPRQHDRFDPPRCPDQVMILDRTDRPSAAAHETGLPP